jgi:hypothetical protein
MNRKLLALILVFVLVAISGFNRRPMRAFTISAVPVGPDLYIKDTPMDTGTEPNPDAGPMWVSDDIWVRTKADPSYQPYPFLEATPPWTPLPHENSEYRDPKFGVPNYVYVRVRNRGTAPSSGTERLRVYFAKASTGLAWPAQFVDNMASTCPGPPKLYGMEITKPRRNAATATGAERNAYRDAIIAAGTTASLVFFGGVTYWHKQQEVHSLGPMTRHGSPAFLPWHREFVNRYEVLLQEANPIVKLLYWDWTTDPENSTGGFNLYPGFMGASGRGTGGTSIGLPFLPPLAPPAVTRSLSTGTTPPADADAILMSKSTYGPFLAASNAFAWDIEKVPNHNSSHGYIGGGGNMSSISTAAQDPFFFLLHGNVDRLWAQWQRNPSSLPRLDPGTTYGSESGSAAITTTMGPWDGTGTAIQPWTPAGGYIPPAPTSPTSPQIVSPPIYDCAPLVIPVLLPGQAVVLQIPWYPPNPADFACFGGDQGHFCLVARVETTSTAPTAAMPCPEPPAPFGMTFPEGSDINTNTRNNNNIAWKNITVVDDFPGALKVASILVRNVFRNRVLAGLRFADTQEIGASFFDFGRIVVDLKPELFKRWREGNGVGRGIEPATAAGGSTIRIASPEAFIQNIRLEPGEVFSVDVRFELSKGYQLPRGGLPKWDLIQTGTPGNPNAIIGGQRFVADFNKLVLVTAGDKWRYLDDESSPDPKWVSPDFDDSKWKLGQAELGFGDNPVTTINAGPPNRRRITTYFRHTFDVADPGFFRSLLLRLKRDDGAVVYVNGTEIHRVNLPGGAVAPGTLATRGVDGLEEEMFFPVRVGLELLRQGRNVIAAEIHQDSRRSPDLSFDLELCANPSFTRFPPYVTFAPLTNGSLRQSDQTSTVTVEALDSDGQIQSVSLFDNGKLIGTSAKPPYTFQLSRPSIGMHRLRAVAEDNDQQRATADLTVTGIANVPPHATLTQPRDGAVFKVGETVIASAEASDEGGKIRRVDFFLRDGELFDSLDRLVNSARTAPYTVRLRRLAPGHYMLAAVATDIDGATSQSIPVHFTIH